MIGADRYLVTGGAGFIGSNFVRHLLASGAAATVTNLDLLTYAGVEESLRAFDDEPRHRFVRGDVRDLALLTDLVADHDIVVHFAAESHVDRSITDPAPFVSTNVGGTAALLEAVRRTGIGLFVHVSTDEVYGSIPAGEAGEDHKLAPSSPYSASKAAADLLVGSYVATHGLPAVITRSTNNYGPFQFPEKVIPLFVTNLLEGKPLPLYGDGSNRRDWLHVEDHCLALSAVIASGTPGEVYNIGSGTRVANTDLARSILALLERDESMIEPVADRPGHDLRYAVSIDKISALGWQPQRSLSDGLADTVRWYQDHTAWWKPLKARA